MFTLKVDRQGLVLFRHFTSREAASEAGRAEMARGGVVLAIFFPGEAWA